MPEPVTSSLAVRSGRASASGALRGFALAALGALCVVAAGCGGGGGTRASRTVTTTGAAPTSTARVYLATAVGCQLLGTGKADGAVFEPLKVDASGHRATIQPIEGCRKQSFFFSYVYDIPVPSSGKVRITPGNQSVAVLDAAKLRRSGARTPGPGLRHAPSNGAGTWPRP